MWHEAPGVVKGNGGNRWDTGDFNGDGKDDIVCFYDYGDYGGAHSALLVFLSTGDGFLPFQKWHEETISYPLSGVGDRFTAGDFDGDGKSDVAVMYDYGNGHTKIHIFRSTGSSFGGTWLGWYEDPSSYSAALVGSRFEAGDFNGDGKDDLVAMFDYSTADQPYQYALHFFRSYGTGLDDWKFWRPISGGYSMPCVKDRFAVADVNGDGKDDVATLYQYDRSTSAILVFTSTGNGFNDWTTWYRDSGYSISEVGSFEPYPTYIGAREGFIVRYNYLYSEKWYPQLHYFYTSTSTFTYNPVTIEYPAF